MKFLLEKVAINGRETRVIADTTSPHAWIISGPNVYEFENRHAAYSHIATMYVKAIDSKSMQPGQSYNLTMADGTTKQVQVQTNNPQGMTVVDPNSGETMSIPHLQPGAEPKPVQQQQPKQPGSPGGPTPSPNEYGGGEAGEGGVSPENRTYALCADDFKITAAGVGREPYYCKHDRSYLLRKSPNEPEKFCPDCGMVYVGKIISEDRECVNCGANKPLDEGGRCDKCSRGKKKAAGGKTFSPFSEAPVFPEGGPKVEYRPYRCMNCGHEQMISTNHLGKVVDYCKECSWKPSFGKAEYAVPGPGGRTYRPFEYAGPTDRTVTHSIDGKELVIKTAVITGGPGSYHVKSEEGKNLGGPYKTREQAEHRLKQVEYFKHKKSQAKDQFHLWKNENRLVRARDIIKQADAPMPGQQAMPSAEYRNPGDALTTEKGPADFGEDPEHVQSQPTDPNAKRKLTPHEIIEEAESLIRNALVKGVKIGAAELQEYMTKYYENSQEELMQGIALAWQKVQYEEKQEAPEQSDAPDGPGFGPKKPLSPQDAARMAPRNGPIRTPEL